MKRMLISAIALALVASTNSVIAKSLDSDDDFDAVSVPQVDTKIKHLRARVRDLENRVDQLEAASADQSVDVNCAQGQTISAVLANNQHGTGMLTINVSGTCLEAFTISRSYVAIKGKDASAIVQSPSKTAYTIVATENAHDVSIENLTVFGGVGAVLSIKGAHLVVKNIVAQQATNGVQAFDNGIIDITGSTISNNSLGVTASRSGVVTVSNSIIENNTLVGALAYRAGTVQLTSVQPDAAPDAGVGPIVRNNPVGGLARAGGFLELSDATITGNRGYGLIADSVSSIDLFVAQNGTGNRITGNGAGGILLQRSSGLVVTDNSNVITGNPIGILCQNSPGYVVPAGFTVTGNTNGDIVGCAP